MFGKRREDQGNGPSLVQQVEKIGPKASIARSLKEVPKLLRTGSNIAFVEEKMGNLDFSWVNRTHDSGQKLTLKEIATSLASFPPGSKRFQKLVLADIDKILKLFPERKVDFISVGALKYEPKVKVHEPGPWHTDMLSESGVRVLRTYEGPSTQFTSNLEGYAVAPPKGTYSFHDAEGKHRQPAYHPGVIRVWVTISFK